MMSVFKSDYDAKRMIFNVNFEIARRLEAAREEAKSFGKRLDVDTAVNKALEKFLKKAEKKLVEMRREGHAKTSDSPEEGQGPDSDQALGDDEAWTGPDNQSRQANTQGETS